MGVNLCNVLLFLWVFFWLVIFGRSDINSYEVFDFYFVILVVIGGFIVLRVGCRGGEEGGYYLWGW